MSNTRCLVNAHYLCCDYGEPKNGQLDLNHGQFGEEATVLLDARADGAAGVVRAFWTHPRRRSRRRRDRGGRGLPALPARPRRRICPARPDALSCQRKSPIPRTCSRDCDRCPLGVGPLEGRPYGPTRQSGTRGCRVCSNRETDRCAATHRSSTWSASEGGPIADLVACGRRCAKVRSQGRLRLSPMNVDLVAVRSYSGMWEWGADAAICCGRDGRHATARQRHAMPSGESKPGSTGILRRAAVRADREAAGSLRSVHPLTTARRKRIPITSDRNAL
jgi:hypothetical protein